MLRVTFARRTVAASTASPLLEVYATACAALSLASKVTLALNEAVQNGQIKTGDLVMTEAMGGGLSWGANLIRWS